VTIEQAVWWSELLNSFGLTHKIVLGDKKANVTFYVARQKHWSFTLSILTAVRYVEEFSSIVKQLYAERANKTPDELFIYLQALHGKGAGNSNHALINGYSMLVGSTGFLSLTEYKKRLASKGASFPNVFSGFAAANKNGFTPEQKSAINSMKSCADLDPLFPEFFAKK
jgi:hypothetical protein